MKTVSPEFEEQMFSGPAVPLIAKLALPMAAAMLVQMIYIVIDTWWVSRIDPADPGIVGGVGLIFPLFMVTMGLASGISVGVNSVTARAIGANNHEHLEGIAENGLLIALILSAAVSIPMILWADPLVKALGAKGTFHASGLAFFTGIIPAVSLGFFASVFTGILQGEGKMKSVMISMLIGTAANLILDPIFIFTLGRGVRGAAEATAVSQLLSLLYLVIIFLRGKSAVSVRWAPKLLRFSLIREITAVGTGQALSMLIMGAAILVMNSIVVRIDTNAMTALTLGQRIDQLLFVPIMAISGALITAVGQNFGRGNTARIRTLWRTGTAMAAVVFLVLASILVASAPYIFPLFSTVPEVIRLAVLQTQIIEFTFVVACSGILARAVFQAMGYAAPSMILTVLRLFILAIPAMLIFVHLFDMGVYGVWFGLIFGNVVSGIAAFIWVELMLNRHEKPAKQRI